MHSSRPNARPGRTRDAYGFEVRNEYIALYKQYAPLWEKEESERVVRWHGFVEQFAPTDQPAKFDHALALEALEHKIAAGSPSGSPADDLPAWQQQLRSLVQAGVPMAFRGRLWKAFLHVNEKKQPGLYKKLVHKILSKELKHETADSRPGKTATRQPADASTAAPPQEPTKSLSGSGQIKPQPPTAEALHSMDSGSGAALSTEAALPPAALAALPPAGTGPPDIPAAADGPTPEVSPDEAMQLNSAINRALLQTPRDASQRPASAQPANLQGKASDAGGSQKSQAQDWQQQIEKDLHRTFPGHPVMDKTGRSALRRILMAYSERNPDVGYCQGMNFIAGCLLLFMDEEDAFWCLAIIAEDLLPGYFSLIMVAPQVDQLVFKQLVDTQFPTLASHLDMHGVNVASVSTQWFLCLFVNSLPLETCLRVWDVFFLEQCASTLFRIALTLVDIYSLSVLRQALLSTVDSIDCLTLLQSMAPMSYDSSRLIDTACIGFAHVTRPHLASLRAVHEAAVQAQFQSPGQIDSKWGPLKSNVGPAAPSKAAEESTLQAVAAVLPPDHQPTDASTLSQASRGRSSKVASLRIDTGGSKASAAKASQDPRGSASSQASLPSRGSDSSLESLRSGDLPGDWHHTPRWKGTSVFCDHTLRHLSKLSNVGFPAEALVPEESLNEDGGQDAKPEALDGGEPRPLSTRPSMAVATAFRIASMPKATSSSSTTPSERPSSSPGTQSPGQALSKGSPGSSAPGSPSQQAVVLPLAAAGTSAAAAVSQPAGSLASPLTSRTASLPPLSPRSDIRKTSSGKSRRPSGEVPPEAVPGAAAAALLPPLPSTADEAPGSRAAPEPGEGRDAPPSPDLEQPRPSIASDMEGLGTRRTNPRTKVLAVAEGLEEELFVAEAHRHDAEVAAEALENMSQELQGKLTEAGASLQEKQAKLEMLRQRLAKEAVTLEATAAQVQALTDQLTTARSQLALKVSLVAEKDALIAALLQQTGQAPSSFGQGLLRNFARFGRQGRAAPTPQRPAAGMDAAKPTTA